MIQLYLFLEARRWNPPLGDILYLEARLGQTAIHPQPFFIVTVIHRQRFLTGEESGKVHTWLGSAEDGFGSFASQNW